MLALEASLETGCLFMNSAAPKEAFKRGLGNADVLFAKDKLMYPWGLTNVQESLKPNSWVLLPDLVCFRRFAGVHEASETLLCER